MTTHAEAVAAYEEQSAAFTLLNRDYNRALRTNTMTDDLELRFMRAERALKEAYAALPALAAQEEQ